MVSSHKVQSLWALLHVDEIRKAGWVRSAVTDDNGGTANYRNDTQTESTSQPVHYWSWMLSSSMHVGTHALEVERA